MPILPVYVVEDKRAARQFVIAVEESLRIIANPSDMTEVERRYAEVITRHRLHQSMFRGMVVRAYQVRCAVCRLRHGELLDAAHITPDSDETGLAIVSNGLSLCKIHHAAYDRSLISITPEYRVEVNRRLLEEWTAQCSNMAYRRCRELRSTYLPNWSTGPTANGSLFVTMHSRLAKYTTSAHDSKRGPSLEYLLTDVEPGHLDRRG